MMKAAVFFERDGILSVARNGEQSATHPMLPGQFRVNKQAEAPLRRLRKAGFLLIGTSNQPWISRGSLSRWELDRMHQLLLRQLPLDDMLICPHDEADRCPCRKPRPGLFTEAAFKWQIDLDRSFVISDKWQDAEAALNCGCTSLLLKSEANGKGHHDIVLDDLKAATYKILDLAQALAARIHSVA